jgi:hypothetical protein
MFLSEQEEKDYCDRLDAALSKLRYLRPLRDLAVSKVTECLSVYVEHGLEALYPVLRKFSRFTRRNFNIFMMFTRSSFL